MDSPRRQFLLTGARLGALAASSLTGNASAMPASASNYPFSLGVASGSPLPNAVVIWTRILHDPLNAATTPPLVYVVRWQMAEDEQFRRIVAEGTASAAPTLAHSVHVDVTGLAAGPLVLVPLHAGRCRQSGRRTRAAAGSMPPSSSWPWPPASTGNSAAMRRTAISRPPRPIWWLSWRLHLRMGPLPAPASGRAVRSNESFTLAEYRARYAHTKRRPAGCASRRTVDRHLGRPKSPTTTRTTATNASTRASWRAVPPPIRPSTNTCRCAPPADFANLRIYQRYDWGQLARFHVLDDRQYRAYQPCTPAGRGGSSSVLERACTALNDPARSMLGPEQQRWLEQGLTSSTARWNILAQQTLMAPNSQLPLLHDAMAATGPMAGMVIRPRASAVRRSA
jgi:alkaline phosphatase D